MWSAHETDDILFDDECLLKDKIGMVYSDLHDYMHRYLEPPYAYCQEIVDEVLDILDRLELMTLKLDNVDFNGSFRY